MIELILVAIGDLMIIVVLGLKMMIKFIIGIIGVISLFGIAACVMAGRYDTAEEWFQK